MLQGQGNVSRYLEPGKDRFTQMERQRVNSTNMRSVGYDAKSQILEVEFTTGAIYQYARVPADLHRRLLSAVSMRSFFEDNIEDNYSAKRVR